MRRGSSGRCHLTSNPPARSEHGITCTTVSQALHSSPADQPGCVAQTKSRTAGRVTALSLVTDPGHHTGSSSLLCFSASRQDDWQPDRQQARRRYPEIPAVTVVWYKLLNIEVLACRAGMPCTSQALAHVHARKKVLSHTPKIASSPTRMAGE